VVAVLESKRQSIIEACARFGAVRLDVFGSALRDDFRAGSSDIDLLVQFRPLDPHQLVDAYFGLLDELRAILGADVDLVMSDAVKNRYIAAEIERTKEVLYAA
jgi:predicted nucleotidyltransferase